MGHAARQSEGPEADVHSVKGVIFFFCGRKKKNRKTMGKESYRCLPLLLFLQCSDELFLFLSPLFRLRLTLLFVALVLVESVALPLEHEPQQLFPL